MIDLHCHILPAIDDGAKSIDEALKLIELAAEQGVSRMVATPHIHPGMFDNNISSINASFNLLLSHIPKNINIQIRTAAEVRICPEIMPLVLAQQLPFIGQYDDKKVLLLELPSSHIPPGTDNLIKWLNNNNITAMIAHPERNREFQSYPERIDAFVRLGCLFQLTASSLLGDMGEKPQVLSELWIKQKLYSIIASDCHSLKRRPPKLDLAFKRTVELVDHDYAHSLLDIMPGKISESLFN